MGQTVSKVTNRVVGRTSVVGSTTTSTTVKPPPTPPRHIPSIPGKTSADAAAMGIIHSSSTTTMMMIDPITGFTRGTAPLTASEERQRQFLESRQYDFIKVQQQQQQQRSNDRDRNSRNTTTTTTVQQVQSPLPPLGTDTRMPEDLLNFIKDMGPVIRNQPKNDTIRAETDENGTTLQQQQDLLNNNRTRRIPRMARLVQQQQQASDHDPNQESVTIPLTETTTTTLTAREQKPGYDKTRITTNMPLANQIPGYETSRTTSFSTKLDVQEEDENTLPGYTMVQFYGLLTEYSKSNSTISNDSNDSNNKSHHPLSSVLVPSNTTTTPVVVSTADTGTTITNVPNTSIKTMEHEQLLQNALRYIQIPVLLKDTDGSYIGAHQEQVSSLLGAHRGMKRLDTTNQAKLILQELYETNHRGAGADAVVVAAGTTTNETTPEQSSPVVAPPEFNLGPSKAESASR